MTTKPETEVDQEPGITQLLDRLDSDLEAKLAESAYEPGPEPEPEAESPIGVGHNSKFAVPEQPTPPKKVSKVTEAIQELNRANTFSGLAMSIASRIENDRTQLNVLNEQIATIQDVSYKSRANLQERMKSLTAKYEAAMDQLSKEMSEEHEVTKQALAERGAMCEILSASIKSLRGQIKENPDGSE